MPRGEVTMNAVSHSHITVDGGTLAYQRRGNGPALLFIQGTGVHGDGWLPQVDELAGEMSCLWYDNRGLGRSDPPVRPVTVEGLAADALALLDALAVPSAHVVGHSLGGLVALQLALSARSRVKSLALLCTFASGRDVAPLSGRMVWAGLRSQIGTRRSRRNGFLELVFPFDFLATADRDALARRLEALFGHDLAVQPAVVAQQLRAMRAANLLPRLPELAGIPSLVLSAAHDPIAPPRLGQAIANGIPGARLVVFDDAAHGLPIQHAKRTNAHIAEHVRACEETVPGAAA